MATPDAPAPPKDPAQESGLRQLTPILVWAVVFCDIGTSVFYVPGLLYENPHVGSLAPLFVAATFLGFLLLASKYVEICWRIPDGGGVVNIANAAFTPILGCLGGLFISVSYFLTSAISSLSGLHYLSSVFHGLEEHVVALAVAALLLLAIVNTIGIRESATLALTMAMASFVVSLAVVLVILWNAGGADWDLVRENLAQIGQVDGRKFIVGFSLAWLAFSGLESISQLSPAMRLPILSTAKRGMRYVVLSMLATSPVLTLFAIALLPPEVRAGESEKLISELGQQYGGTWLRVAVVLTGSSLLLLAANTAIIGCYHVFVALAERGFLPSAVATRNRMFGTPQLAILVATLVPVVVIWIAEGEMRLLGDLYAFGLLGAFGLSSSGVDVLRWRENDRGLKFWVGLGTTAMILVAWTVNLYMKPAATLIGSLLVGLGLMISVGTRRKWFHDWFYSIPVIARLLPRKILESEEHVEVASDLEILSLSQAQTLSSLYPSSTLIAVRSFSPGLIAEAAAREKGHGGRTLYALFVEERTGLFVRTAGPQPFSEGLDTLARSAQAAEAEGMTLIPIWTVSYDATEGILRAAESLGVTAVMIGVSQRNAIYHLLRGHVLAGLTKRLPPGVRLLLYG